jgi:hypothetical protein
MPLTSALPTAEHYQAMGRALLSRDLTSFIEFAFGVVRPGVIFRPIWHLEALGYKLSQVAEGKIKRLMITMPPRSLKSLAASVALPAWFLGHLPSERVVAISYSDALARTTPTTSGCWWGIRIIKPGSHPCAWRARAIARLSLPNAASGWQPASRAA